MQNVNFSKLKQKYKKISEDLKNNNTEIDEIKIQNDREIIERTMEEMKEELKKPEVMAVFKRLKDKWFILV